MYGGEHGQFLPGPERGPVKGAKRPPGEPLTGCPAGLWPEIVRRRIAPRFKERLSRRCRRLAGERSGLASCHAARRAEAKRQRRREPRSGREQCEAGSGAPRIPAGSLRYPPDVRKPVNAGSIQDERGPDGRFTSGRSGNPAGKPRGARNRATLTALSLLDGDAEAIVSRAVAMAKRGDPVALRLCIERLVPVMRGAVVELALPEIRKAEDVRDGCAAVIAAAAEGRISLKEAREFMGLLDTQRRAIETQDLAVRVEMLERGDR